MGPCTTRPFGRLPSARTLQRPRVTPRQHSGVHQADADGVGDPQPNASMYGILLTALLSGTNAAVVPRILTLRGGASASQAILAASGSVVTLGGARMVVDGQKKSSEQVAVVRAQTRHPCYGLRPCIWQQRPWPLRMLLARWDSLPRPSGTAQQAKVGCRSLTSAARGPQERESTTFLGLALLGWGASKFTSIATGSETLYCAAAR